MSLKVVEQIEVDVVALQGRHAMAVANDDAQELDVLSAEVEAAGLLLSAVDGSAQTVPLHERGDQRAKSFEASARALRLATQCGEAVTPAIRSAAQPLPLYPREREIAGLPASGLSNKDIAEQLAESVRTVEGHI